MRSIRNAAKASVVISRRSPWLQSHHHICNNVDMDGGVDGLLSHASGFSRRLTCGIHPPSEVPFHALNSHCRWVKSKAFTLHSNLTSNQTRKIFSLLPSNESSNHDDDDKGTNMLSMPSRQNDKIRLDQYETEQQSRNQVDRRLNEVYELLDSPIGSFPWSRFRALLDYLCESDITICYAFALLDRAVEEPDAESSVTNEMVYQVVHQWLNGYVSQQKSIDKPHYNSYRNGSRSRNGSKHDGAAREGKKQKMLSPLNVWKRINNYQRKGVPLESPTYHKIMEGTTHVKKGIFNNPNGPRLAETILEKMMVQSKHDTPLIRPSAYPFTIAMLSWEQAAAYSSLEASREAPLQALALLNKLKSLYTSGWGNEFMPDKNAYRRVMNLFAHRGDGDQVEALLEDLYALYLDHNEQGHEKSNSLMPTTPFFSLVLYAWSKSRDPNAAERAESILEHMLDMEESKEIPNLKVQSNFFNIVMVCWSKQRTLESAAKVQSIFDRLVEFSKTDPTKKPVGASYMALITTWSRFDPAKAEDAFWKWKEEHDNGTCEMRIDSDLIRTLVSSWCKSSHPSAAERSDHLVQFAMEEPQWNPSTTTFNMIINKWCQEKTLAGLERAEHLLERMIAHHETNLGTDSRPNNLTYLPIIRSWAEIGQLERAEELLVDFFSTRKRNNTSTLMHSNEGHGNHFSADPKKSPISKAKHMDTRIFNCVLKGWLSKASKIPDAVVRAEDILLLTKTFGVKPNYASFQYVLDAWRKNKASFGSPWNQEHPRADAILALLDHEYGRVEDKRELYLNLRRGWKILSVN